MLSLSVKTGGFHEAKNAAETTEIPILIGFLQSNEEETLRTDSDFGAGGYKAGTPGMPGAGLCRRHASLPVSTRHCSLRKSVQSREIKANSSILSFLRSSLFNLSAKAAFKTCLREITKKETARTMPWT